MSYDLVTRAAFVACQAHGKQVRKYSGMPYFVHCAEVASIVAEADGSPEMIAAAYLHDTLEDTDLTASEIQSKFGLGVLDMVLALTNEPVRPGFNRDRRKALDRERLGASSWMVQTIKVADLISNAPSIRDNDPAFAVKFGQEARALLEVLNLADLGLRGRLSVLLESIPKF